MVHVTIENKDLRLRYTVGVPDRTVDAVNNNDITATRNIAKALLPKIEMADKDGTFYRYMEGSKFYFDINEQDTSMKEILQDFLLHGEYEPETTEIVKREVKNGHVCVDVGASHGYFTMLFAKLVGQFGKVYSIEPTENQFKYLKRNIGANGYEVQVIAENLGAWSKEDVQKLKVNANNEKECRVTALDLLLPRKVDFIKIDVDGAEPEVLKGLEETIKNNPQLKMVIEYYPEYIEKMGLNPEDVIDFLDKYFKYDKIGGDLGNDKYWNYYCVRK